jgi:hypothetical protein
VPEVPEAGATRHAAEVTGTDLLAALAGLCLVGCVALVAWSALRAPAVALASVGAVFGATAGYAFASDDGPAGVPVAVAKWALLGVLVNGAAGVVATRATGPPRRLGRAGAGTLFAMPLATAMFGWWLRTACPLYVRGKGTGACNYRHQDLLGGWSSAVILAFALAVSAIGILLLISARQARRADADADD